MTRFFSAPILAAAMLAASCASKPAPQPAAPIVPTQPARYSAEGGSSPVGVIPTGKFHDAQRNKDVDLNIEYPTRGIGPFPVIIFSHGYGSTNSAYESLASYWASFGYIVIRPAHADAGAVREIVRDIAQERRNENGGNRRQRPTREQLEAMQKEREAAEARPLAEVWQKEREPQWRDRVRDISFVIDSLEEIERRFPELRDKIDRKRIGVGGHSYGAFTAMLIAGARTSNGVSGFDPRVRAVIAMSPQGVGGPQNLTAESWRDVKLPLMYMSGTRDTGAEGETPAWRRTAFENSPAGDKYYVDIEGARHLSFVGRGGRINTADLPERDPAQIPTVIPDDPRNPYGGYTTIQPGRTNDRRDPFRDRNILMTIRYASLTFWDAYLKDDAKAKESLKSDVQPFAGATVLKK